MLIFGLLCALLGMENCLDLAIRTEGAAGSVAPTIELAASPVPSGERSGVTFHNTGIIAQGLAEGQKSDN